MWLCDDLQTRAKVALKVQKSAEHYTEAAYDEIDILNTVSTEAELMQQELELDVRRQLYREGRRAERLAAGASDAEDENGADDDDADLEGVDEADLPPLPDDQPVPEYNPHVVQLIDNFMHQGPHGSHMCMVFQTLGDNVLSLIKAYKYQGIPLDMVRKLTRHICMGLDFLHARCGVIHTDLKPENVLLSEKLPPVPRPIEEVEGCEETHVPMTPEEAAAEVEKERMNARKMGIKLDHHHHKAGHGRKAAGGGDNDGEGDDGEGDAEMTAALEGLTGEARRRAKKRYKQKKKQQQLHTAGDKDAAASASSAASSAVMVPPAAEAHLGTAADHVCRALLVTANLVSSRSNSDSLVSDGRNGSRATTATAGTGTASDLSSQTAAPEADDDGEGAHGASYRREAASLRLLTAHNQHLCGAEPPRPQAHATAAITAASPSSSSSDSCDDISIVCVVSPSYLASHLPSSDDTRDDVRSSYTLDVDIGASSSSSTGQKASAPAAVSAAPPPPPAAAASAGKNAKKRAKQKAKKAAAAAAAAAGKAVGADDDEEDGGDDNAEAPSQSTDAPSSVIKARVHLQQLTSSDGAALPTAPSVLQAVLDSFTSSAVVFAASSLHGSSSAADAAEGHTSSALSAGACANVAAGSGAASAATSLSAVSSPITSDALLWRLTVSRSHAVQALARLEEAMPQIAFLALPSSASAAASGSSTAASQTTVLASLSGHTLTTTLQRPLVATAPAASAGAGVKPPSLPGQASSTAVCASVILLGVHLGGGDVSERLVGAMRSAAAAALSTPPSSTALHCPLYTASSSSSSIAPFKPAGKDVPTAASPSESPSTNAAGASASAVALRPVADRLLPWFPGFSATPAGHAWLWSSVASLALQLQTGISTAPPSSADAGAGSNGSSTGSGVRTKVVRVPRVLSPEEEAAARERYEREWAEWEAQVAAMDAYVVDLGNACWTDKHFSEDIQTRQYRSPEVIIGAGYETSADMWSLAAMVFEMITGDLLFDPAAGDEYPRDEDHLAQMQELLGVMPRHLATRGKFSKDYFNKKGELLHIKELRFWGPAQVLCEKYGLSEVDALMVESFMLPCLRFNPETRATAMDCLRHPWLMINTENGQFIDWADHPEMVPQIASQAAAIGDDDDGGDEEGALEGDEEATGGEAVVDDDDAGVTAGLVRGMAGLGLEAGDDDGDCELLDDEEEQAYHDGGNAAAAGGRGQQAPRGPAAGRPVFSGGRRGGSVPPGAAAGPGEARQPYDDGGDDADDEEEFGDEQYDDEAGMAAMLARYGLAGAPAGLRQQYAGDDAGDDEEQEGEFGDEDDDGAGGISREQADGLFASIPGLQHLVGKSPMEMLRTLHAILGGGGGGGGGAHGHSHGGVECHGHGVPDDDEGDHDGDDDDGEMDDGGAGADDAAMFEQLLSRTGVQRDMENAARAYDGADGDAGEDGVEEIYTDSAGAINSAAAGQPAASIGLLNFISRMAGFTGSQSSSPPRGTGGAEDDDEGDEDAELPSSAAVAGGS